MTSAVGAPSGLGIASGEVPRRGTEIEQLAGMRNTGKKLNEISGLNNGQVLTNKDNCFNGINLGIATEYRTASNNHASGAYGAGNGSNIH